MLVKLKVRSFKLKSTHKLATGFGLAIKRNMYLCSFWLCHVVRRCRILGLVVGRAPFYMLMEVVVVAFWCARQLTDALSETCIFALFGCAMLFDDAGLRSAGQVQLASWPAFYLFGN